MREKRRIVLGVSHVFSEMFLRTGWTSSVSGEHLDVVARNLFSSRSVSVPKL